MRIPGQSDGQTFPISDKPMADIPWMTVSAPRIQADGITDAIGYQTSRAVKGSEDFKLAHYPSGALYGIGIAGQAGRESRVVIDGAALDLPTPTG